MAFMKLNDKPLNVTEYGNSTRKRHNKHNSWLAGWLANALTGCLMNALGVEMDLLMAYSFLFARMCTHTQTHTHLTSTDDCAASDKEAPMAKSLPALQYNSWADCTQLKAHPHAATDASRSRVHSRQWMNVSYVHAL